ncbi:MAG: transposase [Bacteroidetes bacterium]|nr:MAG: transposase [Bacteroidota bacterium]
MSQSLAKVYIHCVFSTKHTEPTITDVVRNDLHSYIIGTLSNIGSYVNEIYANPDHLHTLCTLPRTITIAELISKIKTPSSKWLKKQGINNFSWQDGYGVFSVSSSKVGIAEKYILNQAEHHKKVTFKDELRRFFNEYSIEYDERYVWD